MDKRITISLRYLLIFSFLIRAFLAWFLELGNDEVYYVLYARYPDLSHFDHPPMVGFFIQIFSLNLTFTSEFFIRFSSVIFGTLNTYLIFIIAKQLKDEYAGLYAAFLYTSSIYCFIISGTFIMPDTPLVFFWLLSIYFLLASVALPETGRFAKRNIVLAGFTIGLAMLSKYHAVYLWVGAGLYILMFNRDWLKIIQLYVSVFISFLLFLPVIIWNIQNNFISFSFHGERAGLAGSKLRPDLFFTELAGEFFYNNPFVVIIIITALFVLIRKSIFIHKNAGRLLVLTSLPLIATFWIISWFRATLPHWTAPAFLGLIILASVYLSARRKPGRFLPYGIRASLLLLVIVLTFGVLQIKTGFIPLSDDNDDKTRYGHNDVTLDMYGWNKMADDFKNNYSAVNNLPESNDFMLSYRWFPAAHIDYYIARPLGLKTYVWGSPEMTHEFEKINHLNGAIPGGSNAFYITTSRDFRAPSEEMISKFTEIMPADTFSILRSGKIAEYWFLYRLNGYK